MVFAGLSNWGFRILLGSQIITMGYIFFGYLVALELKTPICVSFHRRHRKLNISDPIRSKQTISPCP